MTPELARFLRNTFVDRATLAANDPDLADSARLMLELRAEIEMVLAGGSESPAPVTPDDAQRSSS